MQVSGEKAEHYLAGIPWKRNFGRTQGTKEPIDCDVNNSLNNFYSLGYLNYST